MRKPTLTGISFFFAFAITSSSVFAQVQTASLSKSFNPTTITVGGTTTLTFTLTNPAAFNPAQTVSFADTLPPGLQLAAVPNPQFTCLNVVASAAPPVLTVTSATVPASTAVASTCTMSVDLTNVPLEVGTCPIAKFTNAANNISGAVNVINAVATTCVTVNPKMASLTKAFSPTTIAAGGTTTLTFTITNPAAFNPAQVASFTDTLPSKLQVAAVPNIQATCTGVAGTANPGSNTIIVTSATVPASGAAPSTCTIKVDVTNVPLQVGTCPDANLTNGPSNVTGLINLTNAVTPSCVAVGQTFSISKVASANTLPPNSALSFTITVTNNGPSAANGSILTDPAVAGFAASAISCTGATNGAVCPAPVNVTLANLQGAGIVLPTFPANSTITFQLSGTFTQPSGSVINTATVSSPPGVPLQTQSSSATVSVQIVPPANIPTMSEQAVLALMLLLAVAGATYVRRARR